MIPIHSKNLGQRIQDLRESMGASQEVLAKHLRISRQAIGQMEKGERRVDSLELAKLAEFFSLSTDELLTLNFPEISKSQKIPMGQGVLFNPEKLANLILYILEKCGGKPNVGETVLYKILYFIDFDSFESLGNPVTGMSYLRLQYGPVPKVSEYVPVIEKMHNEEKLNIFSHSYFGKIQRRYVALTGPDLKSFLAAEIEIINKTINRLSDMNAAEITDYVHGDIPWRITPEGEIIPYQSVFERETPYSTKDYGMLFQSASAKDILEELGPISKEEADYYRNL